MKSKVLEHSRLTEAEGRQLQSAVLSCDSDAQALAVRIGPAAVPLLRGQIEHPDSRVRLTALYCLVRIGGRAVIEVCDGALDDNESCIRLRAIREISAHGDSRHVSRLMTAYTEWTDEATRSQLALAIGKLDTRRRTVPELRERWQAERNSGAEEALMVALARLGDRIAQREFVRRLHACCAPETNDQVTPNAPALRFFDHARYIHDRWLVTPLATLLTNTARLIRVRSEGPDPVFLRVCDLALTLAASISDATFGFTANWGQIFTAKQRLHARNCLLEGIRSARPAPARFDIPVMEIQAILRLGNVACKKVMFHALRSAGGEHLSASDLFLSVYSFDAALVLHTLRGSVDLLSLLQFARNRARNAKGTPANHVLRLARALAPAYMPVTVTDLLAALLLDGNNEIAEYLRNRNVSVWKIVERQLQHTLSSPFFFGADESEMKARAWLLQLIPEQGCAYISSGTIEIASSLFPGRVYKIYGDRHTEIFENQRVIADVCIYLEDPSLPETDRVIAEYFLLRGDEKGYLRTANVFRCI